MSSRLLMIRNLLATLQKEHLLQSLADINIFYDEPKPAHYSAVLAFPPIHSDGIIPDGIISSTGISFKSKSEALLKCILEAIERLSICLFKKDDIIFTRKKDLKNKAIDLQLFTEKKSLEDKTIGWVSMTNILTMKQVLVPAQLVYINFAQTYEEPLVSEPIGTGAAAGFSFKNILKNALFEVIERDSFITTYLNKLVNGRIDPHSGKSKKVLEAVNYIARYDLEVHIYDITNDLNIPTVMSLVVDKTGLGPAITIGLKCSYNLENNILDSLGEALTTRIWLRSEIVKNPLSPYEKQKKEISSLTDRGMYWYSQNRIKKLDFLLKTKKKFSNQNTYQKKISYNDIFDKLRMRNYHILYKEITPQVFKNKCQVFKVIVPELQPLYLNEKNRIVKHKRFIEVVHYFHAKKRPLNPTPHPFL